MEIINKFLSTENIAIVGVSSSKMKWGNTLLKESLAKGFKVFPINQKYDSINGINCFKSIDDLPPDVSNVIIALKPKDCLEVISKINNPNIKIIWLNSPLNKTQLESAIEVLKSKNISFISNVCPLMYLNNKGLHKFHRLLHELFNK